MVSQKFIKIVSMIIIGIVVLNIALFALGKASPTLFWTIIVITAVFAYWILPKIRKNT